METALQILTVIASVAGATWVLRSKLSDIETKLAGWVTKTEALDARVIKLERKRR